MARMELKFPPTSPTPKLDCNNGMCAWNNDVGYFPLVRPMVNGQCCMPHWIICVRYALNELFIKNAKKFRLQAAFIALLSLILFMRTFLHERMLFVRAFRPGIQSYSRCNECIFREHVCTNLAALTCGVVSIRLFHGKALFPEKQ